MVFQPFYCPLKCWLEVSCSVMHQYPRSIESLHYQPCYCEVTGCAFRVTQALWSCLCVFALRLFISKRHMCGSSKLSLTMSGISLTWASSVPIRWVSQYLKTFCFDVALSTTITLGSRSLFSLLSAPWWVESSLLFWSVVSFLLIYNKSCLFSQDMIEGSS